MESLDISLHIESTTSTHPTHEMLSIPLMDVLPTDLLVSLLTEWLPLSDVTHLDTALCVSPAHRSHFLRLVAQPWILFEHVPAAYQSPSFFSYITMRNMQITQLVFRSTQSSSHSTSTVSLGAPGNLSMQSNVVSPLSPSPNKPTGNMNGMLLRSRSSSLGSMPTVNKLISQNKILSTNCQYSSSKLCNTAGSFSPGKITPIRASSLGVSPAKVIENNSSPLLTRQHSAPLSPSSIHPETLTSFFNTSSVSPSTIDANLNNSLNNTSPLLSVTRRARSLSLDASSGLLPTQVLPLLSPTSTPTSQRSRASTSNWDNVNTINNTVSLDNANVNNESMCSNGLPLRELAVTGYKKLSDDDLRLFLMSATDIQTATLPGVQYAGLESLDVSGCWRLSDDTLKTVILRHKDSLKKLNLAACFAVTSEGLLQVFDTPVSRLQSFDMSYCSSVDDACVVRLLQTCPSLTQLRVAACVSLTDSSGVAIAQYGHNLQLLDVSGIHNITDAFFTVFGRFTNQHSSVSKPTINRSGALTPAMIYQMSVGGILPSTNDPIPSNTSPDAEAMVQDTLAIASERRVLMPLLCSVNLDSCAKVTSAAVLHLLQTCPNVTDLHIRYCANIEPSAIQSFLQQEYERKLKRFQQLRQAQLAQETDAVENDSVYTVGTGFKVHHQMNSIVIPRLRSLSVST